MADQKQKCPMCSTKLKMINGRMTCKSCGYYGRGQSDGGNTYHTYTYSGHQQPQHTAKSSVAKRRAIILCGFVAITLVLPIAMKLFPNHNAAPRTPQSTLFRQMAESVFDKPCKDVTREEFARITALEIDYDKCEIYCQVDHGDSIAMPFDSNINSELSDLRCFPGLERLSLTGKALQEGDLDGLENLYAVFSENSLSDLGKIIPYPENILELSAESYAHSLAGLQKFPSLQYLTLEYDYVEDISALTEIAGLRGLTLLDCSSLQDFSPLMGMSGLEQLSIDSTKLKTIDFVAAMPNLAYLGVEKSQIISIDVLANCPNLTGLYLVRNDSLMDYSVVGDLENLTELTIYKDYNASIPSLEKLSQLERASFSFLDDDELPLVTAASNISELYLYHLQSNKNLSLLGELPLTSLTMEYCFLSGDHPLAFLSDLPLEYLDMTESTVYGNMEEAFGIPTLQYLCLKEATGVIDFDALRTNGSLLVLDMSCFQLLKDPRIINSYGNIREHYDLFEHFPNLEELYAVSLALDSIEFVSYMPNLQYLNIINNNVSSLKPLENLDNFQTVLCRSNTILEPVSEDSGIYVDMETHYYR